MKKIKMVVPLVGGWLSTMSGGVSIPLALLAIIFGGTAGIWFATLAYIALWVLVLKMAHAYELKLSNQASTHLEHANGQQSEIHKLNVELNSKTFEQRQETIRKTYVKLLEAKDASDAFTIMLEQNLRPERFKLYQAKITEFMEFYVPNEIYIPPATASKIKRYYMTLNAATQQFNMAISDALSPNREAAEGKLFENYDQTNNQLPALFQSMKDDLQKLLGVTN